MSLESNGKQQDQQSTDVNIDSPNGNNGGSNGVNVSFNAEQISLINNAETDYAQSNFSSCFANINSLQKSISSSQQQHTHNSTRISMNKALCELALGHYTEIDLFKKELQRICGQVKLNLDELENLDEAQYCSIFYNYSVVLFFKQQYTKCLNIVEKLYYQFTATINEQLSRQIEIIYAQVLLQISQPDKALLILKNAEKNLKSSTTMMMMTKKKNEEETTNSTLDHQNVELNDSLKHQRTIQILKTKCFLSLNQTEQAEKELKELTKTPSDYKESTLNNLKANLDYLNQNNSDCLRQLIENCTTSLTPLLNLKTNDDNDDDENKNILQTLTTAIQSNKTTIKLIDFNNSLNNNNGNDFLFLLMTSTHKLVKFIDKKNDSFNDNPISKINTITTNFFSNLALVHFSIRKFNLSLVYTQRAINENNKFIRQTSNNIY
jgi:hypothetical protein